MERGKIETWRHYPHRMFKVNFTLSDRSCNFIMRNVKQTQIEGNSTKYLTSTLQNHQCHEKQGKAGKLRAGDRRLHDWLQCGNLDWILEHKEAFLKNWQHLNEVCSFMNRGKGKEGKRERCYFVKPEFMVTKLSQLHKQQEWEWITVYLKALLIN